MTFKLISAVMLGAVLMAGCDASSQGPAGADPGLQEGLTIQDAEPGVHTLAAFRQGERVVYIETRRAEATPAEYREADPSLPAYGTDVRITDAAGALIYARIAGDGRDFAEGEDVPPADAALRQRDIEVARAALGAMTASPALDGQEIGVLRDVNAGFFVAPVQARPVDDVQVAELGGAALPAASTYKHRIALWKKHCCVPGGWHSGTRSDAYSGTYWSAQVDWCNHGTCPGGSGMAQVCSYTSGYRAGVPHAQACSTGYNVTSTLRTHNCNDDSHLEVIDVRHNKLYSTDDGSCHDLGANPDPDGCDPSTW